jgi:hypothetical protein
MSDTYDAVYAAVRSKLGNLDLSSIFANALDLSSQKQQLSEAIAVVGWAMTRPSAVYRPTLDRPTYTRWRARYGEVEGTGASPEEAMLEFDAAWSKRIA